MVSLWQFFGLPDPDGNNPPSGKKKSQQRSASQIPSDVLVAEPADIPEPVTRMVSVIEDGRRIQTPFNWNGPVTAEGEPFHDLGVPMTFHEPVPNTAVRYVRPDEKFRIPFLGMFERVAQGDSVVLDLRQLLHMDAHQDALRRELKSRSNNLGIGVYALDEDDKLFLIPGNNVVVDSTRHDLGLTQLL